MIFLYMFLDLSDHMPHNTATIGWAHAYLSAQAPYQPTYTALSPSHVHTNTPNPNSVRPLREIIRRSYELYDLV